ncbi:hypothetical protein LTR78_010006 [Recurvomyces mirabilis]|uniref:Heterokaryon incompatibility domain-containing protein n=1 Tax=Recurvomyces mirabilis TaxID=574656 RepID=A0AAE0TSR4_9PEZI|nr:hypothetical protein LTR78_010006 [Recurvomyces mirabilis]KAK5149787.1 hypothetical protein LTS14_010608 [Recurvomyces mirabilis]
MATSEHRLLYPPVKVSGPKETRILDLLPGSWHDALAVTIQVVSLDTSPTYKALSYVWGPSTEGRSVVMDGTHGMPITDNLHRGLRRIRQERNITTLWIDAICINQDDVGEKSQQVAMMGDIYRTATDTIVWLGESERTSSIHLRPVFASLVSFEYYLHSWTSDIYWMVQQYVASHSGAVQAAAEHHEADRVPPWYSRAWTVQEFILSRNVHLYWGRAKIKYSRSTLPYDMVMVVSPGIISKARDRCGVDVFDIKHRLNILEAFRGSDFAGQRLLDAYNALFTYSGLPQATDPRDRVHSVLGLIDAEEARLIGVDYNLTCEQVSAKATFASIKRYGDLEALFYVQLKRPSENRVPSWAVDFISAKIPNW